METPFNKVDTVRAPDNSGIVAEITSRKLQNGFIKYSFAFFREFEVDGKLKRTSYLPERALGSMIGLLSRIESRIKLEQDRLLVSERLASERLASERRAR